jgi:O-antigen/teichoic acid export membrane protein
MKPPTEFHEASVPDSLVNAAPSRSLGQLAVRGGGYMAGREAAGMVIRLIGVVLVVRLIGPGPYGIYAAAAAFAGFIAAFAQLGLEVYLIRLPGELEARHYNQAFTLLLVVSIVATAAAEGLTFAFGSFIRPVGVLVPLRVLLLTVPINVLWAPSQAAIERAFRYRLMGLLEFGGDVALYTTAVTFALLGAKEWSLVAGYFVWQIWLFVGSSVTSGLRLRLDWSTSSVKEMTRHGFSYSTAQWAARVGDLVNPLVVGTFLGATGVGFVAFGQRLVETVAFAKRGAYRLGMVAMSRVGNDEEGRLRYSIEEGSLLQLLALAIPIACFGIAARWLVPVAFGHQWVKALPVYSLLALATVLGASGFIQTAYLFSRGRNMSVTGAAAIQSVVLAGVAAALVKPIGLEGYGVAWIVSLVWLIYADRAVRKMFSFSYRRILPWMIALGPAALFPLPPLPWAYLLLAPLLLMLTPTMRSEIHRLVELIRSSLARPVLVPAANAMAGPTP